MVSELLGVGNGRNHTQRHGREFGLARTVQPVQS